MLRLFLEGKELELTEDVQVAITKQFEELSNPTTIINDWSKTVSIPFTHNNDRIFGYFFRPDKLTTYMPSSNYLSTAPSRIKKWNGSDYVDDSLSSGNIVCDINAQYVQVGFQYQDWKYSNVKNFTCNNDWHSFEFNYISEEDYRFEFSFRDMSSDAPNNEVYFVQWDLYNRNLTENETYVVSFKHKKSGNNYIIYDYSLSKKQSLTGVNFDPLQKLDFRLEWNGATLMTGYAKLNEIKQKDGNGTYNITLFGQLGKVLQEMKKITFDKSTNDTQYLIHGEDYVNTHITKDLVYNSWMSSGQTTYDLKKIGDTGYNVTDIIGFAPNDAFSEGFDYKSYQYVDNSNSENKIETFTNTLGDSFTNATGISSDSVIPKGMTPRGIGEFRSYLQLPFIYFNKLFKIFKKKVEDLTGYEMDLDSDWFKEANPYWSKLVMMLKTFEVSKDENAKHNTYAMRMSDEVYWPGGTTFYAEKETSLFAYSKSEQQPIVNGTGIEGYNPAVFSVPSGSTIKVNFEVPMMIQSPTVIKNSNILGAKLANGMLYVRIGLICNDVEIDYRIYKVRSSTDDENDTYGSDYTSKVVINGGDTTRTTGSYYYWDFNIKDSFIVTDYDKNYPTDDVNNFYIYYDIYWENRYGNALEGNPVLLIGASSYSDKIVYVRQQNDAVVTMDISNTLKRSYSRFTLNDLWNKDFNLYDVIINYCKVHRIAIQVDDINKKIKFLPYYKLFEGYKVVNWTDKVDKSKDFTVKPVSFDKKYVLFNYADNKTYLGEEYKKKYGVNYGDYKITTDYNFNTDTEKLFDKTLVSPIAYTSNVLSWSNIYTNHKIIYSFPAEIFPYNKDKDDKAKDLFGCYYFHNGTIPFSTEPSLNLRSVILTDDGIKQVTNNTYCYTQNSTDIPTPMRSVTNYPNLDIVRGSNLCTLNVPSEDYTYAQNYANKKSIYKNLWEKYINERYNRQNKLITCYVTLKPSDFVNFSFKNFVLIDDTLCIVNKIYDYDVTSSNSTKVDLLTVQNIEGYTDDSFFREYSNGFIIETGGDPGGGGGAEELG